MPYQPPVFVHRKKFNVFTFSQAQTSLSGGLIREFHLLLAYNLLTKTLQVKVGYSPTSVGQTTTMRSEIEPISKF